MGSHDEDAAPSQQLVFEQQSSGNPAPIRTRLAASPYLSRTISHVYLLFAAKDFFWLHSLITRATFGIEKAEELLKGLSVGRIPEIGGLTPDAHQVPIFQFFQRMGIPAPRSRTPWSAPCDKTQGDSRRSAEEFQQAIALHPEDQASRRNLEELRTVGRRQ